MPLEDLRNTAAIVRSQHERFDGNGFPDSLAGSNIPIGARILAIANDYDLLIIGMATGRGLTPEEAKALILRGKGKRYDPQLVDVFVALKGGIEPYRPRERPVSPAQLMAGMILTRDIVTREGILLLSADHLLEEKVIQQIKDFVESENPDMRIYVRGDKSVDLSQSK